MLKTENLHRDIGRVIVEGVDIAVTKGEVLYVETSSAPVRRRF